MFLAKLWVRIKGEFLVARESLSEGLDSREAGKKLLNKVQMMLKGQPPGRREETAESESNRREIRDSGDKNYHPKSMREMKKSENKGNEAENQKEDRSPNHNARKLG